MNHDPALARPPTAAAGRWTFLTPKLVTCLGEGYGLDILRRDALAGLTVAIVALPLALAIAIASGVPPERGLYTAIIAGFLISALGGSRWQIGGPTGAFVVVVSGVVAAHGFDGLVIATVMAGVMLMVAALLRLGAVVRFVPYPVVLGFTAGIGIIIATTQVRDLLGLDIATMPGDVPGQWAALATAAGTVTPATAALGLGSLGAILALRRWRPAWPGFLIVVAGGAALVALAGLPIETIGSRFGALPTGLPSFSFPVVDAARLVELLPSAATIAFLAGVESLLSAVVADSMSGGHHRPDAELMGQGVANIAAALLGGICATGAIARTATNVRAGARTPVAGMIHALLILVFLLVAGPAIALVPLASLAAVLLVVAWSMAEAGHVWQMRRGPRADLAVLVVTLVLTVFVDLTAAIEVGIVLAAILFMKRMIEVTQISAAPLVAGTTLDGEDPLPPVLPRDVHAIVIRGPFFFGVARRLSDELDRIGGAPRALVLRMRDMPTIDATGLNALEAMVARSRARGVRVILTGVQPQPMALMTRAGFAADLGPDGFAPDLATALGRIAQT